MPCCLRRAKKQGCRRQPCSLSVFDGLKPMQFGFFGFLGIFFPKKIPKWGMGRSPIYNGSRSGCGVKPRIYTFPHAGVRGAQPREDRFPLGGAKPQYYRCFAAGVGSAARHSSIWRRMRCSIMSKATAFFPPSGTMISARRFVGSTYFSCIGFTVVKY